jgi:hypothetical protein
MVTVTPWSSRCDPYPCRAVCSETTAFRWKLADAWWLDPIAVEQARASRPPARFAAEYRAEFVGASDGLLDPEDIRACVADYALVATDRANGGDAIIGLDWGNRYDSQAIVVVSMLDDHGVNTAPVLYLPWLEISQRPYEDQVAEVVQLAHYQARASGWADTWIDRDSAKYGNGAWTVLEGKAVRFAGRKRAPKGYAIRKIMTERNGVGAAPSEALERRLGSHLVESRHSRQESKERDYGMLRGLLQARRIVLPQSERLLRELAGSPMRPPGRVGYESRRGRRPCMTTSPTRWRWPRALSRPTQWAATSRTRQPGPSTRSTGCRRRAGF